ncbi:MAG: hypothetical protein U9R66_07345 [Thermodesulfobacteriota bacterium]|nr:hypothetical protein [Thermodesulfobacteriota bacterium]
MVETPRPRLIFEGTCPDCGERRFPFPQHLPDTGDDFDWLVRDYEGFRAFMLDELAARFPDRRKWTAADLEMVMVEVLSAVLDQLSDMADRVAGEAYLETARRPESVRRLLKLIGYSAVDKAISRGNIASGLSSLEAEKKLDSLWLREPNLMDKARQDGPREIHTQQRMVTVEDYAERLEDHPLVLRAHSWVEWSGSWSILRAAVIGWNNTLLDDVPIIKGSAGIKGYEEELKKELFTFHTERDIYLPHLGDVDDPEAPPVLRTVLRPYLEAYRMVGREVIMEDAIPVGISMSLSLRVRKNYFQSEVRLAVAQALATGPEGFFEPGRLRFGEDLHASDIIETLMTLEGVENVCLNRFKKIGQQFADASDSGTIVFEGLEIGVCDNNPEKAKRGYYRLTLNGGRKG